MGPRRAVQSRRFVIGAASPYRNLPGWFDRYNGEALALHVLSGTPSYNIAALKCQIRLGYRSSDSILNPFSEAESDETMLEQQ